MATQLMTNDPVKAKEYFQAKMTFTTGPIELERMWSMCVRQTITRRGTFRVPLIYQRINGRHWKG